MNEDRAHSSGESVAAASGWLVGGGLITLALFPLAIPILVLTAVAVLPFVLVPLAGALAVAVVAVPILLVRRLGRNARGALRRKRTAERGRPDSHSGPNVLPPARAQQS